MRNLMISSILATDMGLHFDYMKKLGDVQERLQANNSADGWNGRQIEENKSLACSLLIKCADISNVVCLPLVNGIVESPAKNANLGTKP
jgi:hypothetical protein